MAISKGEYQRWVEVYEGFLRSLGEYYSQINERDGDLAKLREQFISSKEYLVFFDVFTSEICPALFIPRPICYFAKYFTPPALAPTDPLLLEWFAQADEKLRGSLYHCKKAVEAKGREKATEPPAPQPRQGEVPGAGGGVKKQNLKLVLRTSENKVYWEGKEQEGLSPKPYQFLYVLALTPGELIPYSRMKWLISADTENLPKALSKHISSIKAHIPALKNIIHNTEDLGYELRLKKEDVLVQGKIAEVDTLLQLD